MVEDGPPQSAGFNCLGLGGVCFLRTCRLRSFALLAYFRDSADRLLDIADTSAREPEGTVAAQYDVRQRGDWNRAEDVLTPSSRS